ncbi:MAG: hypothetical protein IJO08_00515 [Clostridia bacterium]|nr:hypothetical protein [Clostridia bacterium]
MEEAKLSFSQKIQKKFDELIGKNMPKGKEAKRTNWWLGACAATVAAGLYTGIFHWSTTGWAVVRTAAHLTGAMAIPAAGAFASSLVMSGIEMVANTGINIYNKRHPEKRRDVFKINPKVKDIVKLISTAAVGVAYAYGTLGTEAEQFAKSGIFQTHQYIADIAGSAAGIFAFNKLEPRGAIASFMNKVNTLSKAIVKPINSLEEKIKNKKKVKDEVGKSSDLENKEEAVLIEPQTREQWLKEMREKYNSIQHSNFISRDDASNERSGASKDKGSYEVEM